MKANELILQYKHFTPIHKLILIVIESNEVPSMNIGCNLCSQDMANLLGLTKGNIQDEFFALIELGLITSIVENRMRHTRLTSRTKRLIKKG